MTAIVGAGLAGLVAAHAFPRLPVYEASPEPFETHRALLRFRSDLVSQLTGIPFRRVTVHKGIWSEGAFVEPSIRQANLYSQKVIGALQPRSIWNLAPVHRYIAPETFYEQMVEQVGARIHWDADVDLGNASRGTISTAPLSAALKANGISHDLDFQKAPISVLRWRLPQADIHQTIYYTNPEHTLYRASITGDLLIAEFASSPRGCWADEIAKSFALPDAALAWESLGQSHQRFGKIAPVAEEGRKQAVAQLTRERGIFSLGRFATWRNILLDDLIRDISVIKRLMAADDYERRLAAI